MLEVSVNPVFSTKHHLLLSYNCFTIPFDLLLVMFRKVYWYQFVRVHAAYNHCQVVAKRVSALDETRWWILTIHSLMHIFCFSVELHIGSWARMSADAEKPHYFLKSFNSIPPHHHRQATQPSPSQLISWKCWRLMLSSCICFWKNMILFNLPLNTS